MKFAFHPDALAEYTAAVRYYAQRRAGLELRFIESIEHAIASLREAPESGRVFDGEVRRWLAHIFPYAVLYTIESDSILIVAVMHCRREPRYWSDRHS